MHPAFVSPRRRAPVPIWFVTRGHLRRRCASELGAARAALCRDREVRAEGRAVRCCCRARTARSRGVLFGLEAADKAEKDRFLPGRLPGLLPAGTYRFANAPHDTRLAALAFALGTYRFTRYRKAEANGAKLVIPDGVDGADLSRIAEGVTLARDLINTPANDLGPAELEAGCARPRGEARRDASASIVGDDLLTQNFPLIHAVGRAVAARAAPDRHHLGRRERAEGHAGRQGRVLRHRRARHQAASRPC